MWHNLYLLPLLAFFGLSTILAVPSAKDGVGRYATGPRIINGTQAEANATRHQASIRRRYVEDFFFGTGHICGGSLIAPNVVLSASHCFVDDFIYDGTYQSQEDFVVVMGNLDRFERESTLVFDIQRIIHAVDPFDLKTYDKDIALLILNGSVPADHPTIKPIEINRVPVETGTVCQVTGWGKTEETSLSDKLMTVDVPAIDTVTCANRSEYTSGLITPGMFCAGYMEEGLRDSCAGDSGGPLVCLGKQAGIVSWGNRCALPRRPGVYTEVSFYASWINNQLRIINGTLAEANATRHQASIRRRYQEGIFFGTGHICGGSLISPNVVLSASHCFVDPYMFNGTYESHEDFVVVMGNLDRFEQENTLVFDIERIVHGVDTFNLTSYDKDIALLFLNGSVPSNHSTIKPIEINRVPVKTGTVCQVTGWGKTEETELSDKLMTLDVPFIDTATCANTSDYTSALIKPGMFCAGYMDVGERDSCAGDSGGPLVCLGKQAGIVSWGTGCAKPRRPGVYTEVSFYASWIDKQLKNSQAGLRASMLLLSVLFSAMFWPSYK